MLNASAASLIHVIIFFSSQIIRVAGGHAVRRTATPTRQFVLRYFIVHLHTLYVSSLWFRLDELRTVSRLPTFHYLLSNFLTNYLPYLVAQIAIIKFGQRFLSSYMT